MLRQNVAAPSKRELNFQGWVRASETGMKRTVLQQS